MSEKEPVSLAVTFMDESVARHPRFRGLLHFITIQCIAIITFKLNLTLDVFLSNLTGIVDVAPFEDGRHLRFCFFLLFVLLRIRIHVWKE